MSLEQQLLVIIQIFVAAILSMIIGIDRERQNKPAGLRTHMLTGVGACLFTALSMSAFPSGDPTRVAQSLFGSFS
jgi:putative Mg2+ transporter-C (MgtC) family protein